MSVPGRIFRAQPSNILLAIDKGQSAPGELGILLHAMIGYDWVWWIVSTSLG